MDDAGAVRAVERAGDLTAAANHLVVRQRAARQPAGQGLALDELEDQILMSLVLADIVQRADVRMIERRQAARFTLEPLLVLRRRSDDRRHHFDRDDAVEAGIAGFEHLAHSAGAKRRQDFVRSEARAAGQAHRMGADYTGGES